MHNQDPSESVAPPLVSVCITAFNSEKWIARALDSVLLQKTSFPIEIVIGDDCSKDGTLAVARSYQEQNPHLIRVLERSKNLGMQRNYYGTFEQCRGRYIAWLDADDYWTDPQKLALQVQVLESDPSVSVCGHFVRQVTKDRQVIQERTPSMPPGRYGLKEIILQNFVPSPTIMFRNGIHRDLPEWFFDLTGLADWPILVAACLSGDIVLLDRLMADYVLTPGSSYMSKDSLHQETIDLEFCEQMQSMLPSEWHRYALASRGRRYESIAYLLRVKGDFTASREAALKAFCLPALTDNCGSKIKGLLIAIACEAKWKLQRGRAASRENPTDAV
jgi:glycosyltransferase involved in cell wall biosynthesis